MDLRRGDVVDVRFTKWGGARHWEFAATYLGRDEHGLWTGAGAGTRCARPGAAFTSKWDWLSLFPAEQPWAASFYPHKPELAVYVDVTTAPVWSGREVSMVDLDLDVIRLRDGSLVLDDEDEFDEHRVALGYPDDVVAMARRTSEALLASVGAEREPFGAAAWRWLSTFYELAR